VKISLIFRFVPLLFPVLITASAAEYFVSPLGNDASPGSTQAQAFRTIQKGLDALAAGDALTIGPGEYFEHVSRKGLGDLEKDTVIRAALPGTVLLRGDVPMPEFKKVEGFRFVFAAQVEKKPVAVMEVDTLSNLAERFGRTEIEFQPGIWFYDGKTRTLNFSSSDLEVPTPDRFRLSGTPDSGFILENPQRVTVEGLAFTGFYPAEKKKWPYTNYVGGLMLIEPISCVVRECTPFLNGQGICLVGGQGNIAHDREDWQVDTGPLVIPSPLSRNGDDRIARLRLAYVLFNRWDYVEFAMQSAFPIGEEKTSHYSEIIALNNVKHELFCTDCD